MVHENSEGVNPMAMRYLKTGLRIWLWMLVLWFSVLLILMVVVAGTGLAEPEMLPYLLALAFVVTFPIGWLILGWSAHRVLKVRR